MFRKLLLLIPVIYSASAAAFTFGPVEGQTMKMGTNDYHVVMRLNSPEGGYYRFSVNNKVAGDPQLVLAKIPAEFPIMIGGDNVKDHHIPICAQELNPLGNIAREVCFRVRVPD